MKAILFDADGVVIKKGKEYFSQRFAREYSVPIDELQAFFKNEFRLCQVGKADLKEELASHLPAWGWKGSVEEFLTYWFESDVSPDKDVLAEVKRVRERGIVCCLATDQEKYRAEYLREKLGFGALFDKLFFSCDVGYSKSEPEFFVEATTRLGLSPAEIKYWDDDEQNVATARSLGIDAHFYRSLEDLKNQ